MRWLEELVARFTRGKTEEIEQVKREVEAPQQEVERINAELLRIKRVVSN